MGKTSSVHKMYKNRPQAGFGLGVSLLTSDLKYSTRHPSSSPQKVPKRLTQIFYFLWTKSTLPGRQWLITLVHSFSNPVCQQSCKTPFCCQEVWWHHPEYSTLRIPLKTMSNSAFTVELHPTTVHIREWLTTLQTLSPAVFTLIYMTHVSDVAYEVSWSLGSWQSHKVEWPPGQRSPELWSLLPFKKTKTKQLCWGIIYRLCFHFSW